MLPVEDATSTTTKTSLNLENLKVFFGPFLVFERFKHLINISDVSCLLNLAVTIFLYYLYSSYIQLFTHFSRQHYFQICRFFLSIGLPTKDTTSTTTVESLSSLVLTNSVDCNRSLTVFLFPIFFINVYKGQTKSKDRHTV